MIIFTFNCAPWLFAQLSIDSIKSGNIDKSLMAGAAISKRQM